MAALRKNTSEDGARERQLRAWETIIRDGMARYLWVSAYADYAESEEGRADDSVRRPRPGGNWMTIAPDVPDAARQAADDLATLFGNVFGGGTFGEFPMTEILGMAMELDTGEPFQFTDEERMRPLRTGKVTGEFLSTGGKTWGTLPRAFGEGIAAYALGEGSNWFDDHKRFQEGLEVRFECHYDGEYLTWYGGTAPTFTGRFIGRIHVVEPRLREALTRAFLFEFPNCTDANGHHPALVLAYGDDAETAQDTAIDHAMNHFELDVDQDGWGYLRVRLIGTNLPDAELVRIGTAATTNPAAPPVRRRSVNRATGTLRRNHG